MTNKNQWEAWVDTMPGPGTKPTLRVHGKLSVDGKAEHSLVRAEPQGINVNILLLDVTPKPGAGDREISLDYEEPVDDPKKYTQVTIRETSDVTVDVRIVS